MPIGRILEAELSSQVQEPIFEEEISQRWKILTDNQLTAMVKFANRIPHFSSLPFDDQSYLLLEGMLLFVHPELSACITTVAVRNTEVTNFCAAMDTLIDHDAFRGASLPFSCFFFRR